MKIIVWILCFCLAAAGCSSQVAQAETAPAAQNTQAPETLPETLSQIQIQPSEEILMEETLTEETLRETVPQDTDFVKITDYIPTARQELHYAASSNFTGQVIYDFTDAYLRYGTVKKLMAVSRDLAELDLSLKIWDGFRPVSAQYKLWEVCPDPTYVANPNKGYSSHSRGNTVDLTLVDSNGVELQMPTDFDDFTAKADRDYTDCSDEERKNAEILELLMQKHGFTGYFGEWWHYSDTVSYPVEENFEPQ